jgi:hypothetical protein
MATEINNINAHHNSPLSFVWVIVTINCHSNRYTTIHNLDRGSAKELKELIVGYTVIINVILHKMYIPHGNFESSNE